MANETKIEIKGNYLVATDITTREQYFRLPLDQVNYNRDENDGFWFTNNAASLGATQDLNIVGNTKSPILTEPTGATYFEFASIVDSVGVPYASADAFEDFLAANLGVLFGTVNWGEIQGLLSNQTDLQSALDAKEDYLGTPAVDGYILSSTTGDVRSWISLNGRGVESFYLNPRGSFGTGMGWADAGFIGDVSVTLFNPVLSEKATYGFHIPLRAILTTINPQISFLVYSTVAPTAPNKDVRWKLDARYIAEGELATKTPDESLLFTQSLSILTSNTRQVDLVFTLNKALITDKDDAILTLTRIGGDAADTYADDVGVGKAGLIIETFNHNP